MSKGGCAGINKCNADILVFLRSTIVGDLITGLFSFPVSISVCWNFSIFIFTDLSGLMRPGTILLMKWQRPSGGKQRAGPLSKPLLPSQSLMQHQVDSSGSHQFLRDSDLFFLHKLGGNSAAVDGVERPGTGPSWSLHAAPDGHQVQMRGIAIGQYPAHRNMRDWFDQESVLSASRRMFKYQVKLLGEHEESSLALGKRRTSGCFSMQSLA